MQIAFRKQTHWTNDPTKKIRYEKVNLLIYSSPTISILKIISSKLQNFGEV